MTTAVLALLSETRAAISRDPVLRAFVGTALPADLPQIDLPARRLPATALVAAGHWSGPLAKAVVAAAPDLYWQQSYTLEDGFDADYLARYGWFNLVSPDGPYLSETLRISVGFWDSGLFYKEHWHAPEEIYLVLAGHAVFNAEGRDPVRAGPGSLIHHLPNQKHSIQMTPGPLLAMAFWKGEALMAKSGLK